MQGHKRTVRRSWGLVILGGCLYMVFATGTMSPATTEYLRSLGASDFHFGLLSGIPMLALFLQFAGAAINNRLRHRKPFFIWLHILSRVIYLPIPFLPAWLGPERAHWVVPVVIAILGLSSCLVNITVPPWYSWMADLLPHRILNRSWGRRQFWMQITWTAAYLAATLYTWRTAAPIDTVITVLFLPAVALGVLDIVLFFGVHEPPNTTAHDVPVLESLLAPLRHPQYGTFVLFACIWNGITMFGAAFMQVYCLQVLGMPVWMTMLLWCAVGLGTGLPAAWWGRIADRHGHKPVLWLCVLCKPWIALVFVLIQGPQAFWILAALFLVDGVWNAGISVAQNGYMLKIAPQKNRSMFVASISGLSGIAGGLGAIAGGWFLTAADGFHAVVLDKPWGHYELLFFVNFFMRVAGIPLLARVREPATTGSWVLLNDILEGMPRRMLRFPVGLYGRMRRPGTFHGPDSRA